MLGGLNLCNSVPTRQHGPVERLCRLTPETPAKSVLNAEQSSRKSLRNAGIAASVARNWIVTTMPRSIFCTWEERSSRHAALTILSVRPRQHRTGAGSAHARAWGVRSLASQRRIGARRLLPRQRTERGAARAASFFRSCKSEEGQALNATRQTQAVERCSGLARAKKAKR